MNIALLLSEAYHKTWTIDWHKYMEETEPFSHYIETLLDGLRTKNGTENFEKNMTLQESNAVFRNPWHWMATIDVWQEDAELPKSFSESPLVLRKYNEARMMSHFFLLACNTTGTVIGYTFKIRA